MNKTTIKAKPAPYPPCPSDIHTYLLLNYQYILFKLGVLCNDLAKNFLPILIPKIKEATSAVQHRVEKRKKRLKYNFSLLIPW
jgi:hypothetical protein